jgi:integrase
MSDRSIARLIQKYAGRVGLEPETVGGHSLRAGFLTEASRNGATIAKMQEVSRHKKVEVLLGYVRSAELFDDHAGDGFCEINNICRSTDVRLTLSGKLTLR